MVFRIRTGAAVFQSPSAPNPNPSAINRCAAIPGSWASPWRSSNVSVNAPKPPRSRNARRPASIRAASTSDPRRAPPPSSGASS